MGTAPHLCAGSDACAARREELTRVPIPVPARSGDEVETTDACPSPAVYIVSSNKAATKLLVPVGLHLMEKRVELAGLRPVCRFAP
jgi:hypothetical protein